jgi:hypothetical protein
VPYTKPGWVFYEREWAHKTGVLYVYLDPLAAEDTKVIQARNYDPELIAVCGPYNGEMVFMNWGGGRHTAGAFAQCADCMRAGLFVLPRYYEWRERDPHAWLHVGAYCGEHVEEQRVPEYEPRLTRWSGDDLVFDGWEGIESPVRRPVI